MTTRTCRWGILGTAHIARKNWQAIALAGNASLVAVASRSLERSRQFVADGMAACPVAEPPAPIAGYDELLARADVDAVYLPLPTGVRKQWVLKAAAAGKHVLVEKPVGVTADDVREMLAVCAHHGVQLMDGVMYLHGRRLEALRRTLDDAESVGEVRRIASQFSFAGDDAFSRGDIRMHSVLEPHGCLGDLGWYTLGFALWVMHDALPARVSGRLLAEAGRPDSPGKVPTEMSAELVFPGGASASLYCSFRTENQQWANVSGTKGFVHVPDFVLPFFGDETGFSVTNSLFETHGCDFDMRGRTRQVRIAEYGNSHASSQEAALFRDFSALVLAGRCDPHWGEVALKTQQVLDAVRRSASERREVMLG